MVVRSSKAPGRIEGETGAGFTEHLGGAVDQLAFLMAYLRLSAWRLVDATVMWAALKRADCKADVFTLPFRRRIAAWAGLL